jgi:hypothetical protein
MAIITNSNFFTDILFSPRLSTKKLSLQKAHTVVTVLCTMQIIYMTWIHH